MNIEQKYNIKKPSRKKFWIKFSCITALMTFFYYIALSSTDLSFSSTQTSALSLFRRLFFDTFFDATVQERFPDYVRAMGETMAIAFAGTFMASILAIPFGFLAAKNMSGNLSGVGKAVLNAIRAFPEMLFAVIFVASVGFGPFAGVLAIGVNSIGMLGKLYAEVIESIDMSVVEALKASGANRLQAIWYGVIPQIVPEFSSYAIYRFEIDVRASTVLGLVGAGGIGAPIILASNQRAWEQVGMMLIIIIVVVTAIDYLSAYIRRRIV